MATEEVIARAPPFPQSGHGAAHQLRGWLSGAPQLLRPLPRPFRPSPEPPGRTGSHTSLAMAAWAFRLSASCAVSPPPLIFSGRRQIWQLIVHFLWQTYDYSHVNSFVHISSCFHGNTRLRMKNPKLEVTSGLLTACFPRGPEGISWPGGQPCRRGIAAPQHPGQRKDLSFFVRNTGLQTLSGLSQFIKH